MRTGLKSFCLSIYRMAVATLKLSDLELIYAQLNALRHHVGLYPLNPKEYLIHVDGKEIVRPPVLTQPPSSSVALVVPVIVPPSDTAPKVETASSSSVALVVPVYREEYTDNEEEEEEEDEETEPPRPVSSRVLKPYDVSSHSWVSGF